MKFEGPGRKIEKAAAPASKAESHAVTTELVKASDFADLRTITLEAAMEEEEAIGADIRELSTHSDEMYKADIADPRKFFVISKAGKFPIGMGAMRKEKPGVWHLYSVYVNKDYRGHGISKEIMSKIVEEARQRGDEKINLLVGIKQEEAIGLYTKFGFKTTETLGKMDKKDKWVDTQYAMELDFDEFDNRE
jgi:ribosomal protein S18 acetylase RimI-like enzyme